LLRIYRTVIRTSLLVDLHELAHWTGHSSRLKRDLPFNGDGKLDLAMANYGSNAVTNPDGQRV
jgi:hypothetical protein